MIRSAIYALAYRSAVHGPKSHGRAPEITSENNKFRGHCGIWERARPDPQMWNSSQVFVLVALVKSLLSIPRYSKSFVLYSFSLFYTNTGCTQLKSSSCMLGIIQRITHLRIILVHCVQILFSCSMKDAFILLKITELAYGHGSVHCTEREELSLLRKLTGWFF